MDDRGNDPSRPGRRRRAGTALGYPLSAVLLALTISACSGSTGAAPGGTSRPGTATPSTTPAALTPCQPSPAASNTPTTLLEQADALAHASRTQAATHLYDKVLGDAKAKPADRVCAARGLAALEPPPSTPTPKSPQQQAADGWDQAYKTELKPLQSLIVPMLIVLAVLLGLSRVGTPVFVGPKTPGPARADRSSRVATASAYWGGVVAMIGASCLAVWAIARAATWSRGTRQLAAGVAVGVSVLTIVCAIAVFFIVGRSPSVRSRGKLSCLLAGVAGAALFTAALVIRALESRAWLIAYAAIGGAVAVVLVSRVRGLENRVQIQGRTPSGSDDASAAARVRLRLAALGSATPKGLEVPEQTDLTKLPDDALSLIPEGAFARAVFRVVQTFLPASPWRVSVADLGDDRIGVTVLRNGRAAGATVVHAADLGVLPADDSAAAAAKLPHGALDVGAAAFVLTVLVERYDYLRQGLAGATKWQSIAAQAVSADPSMALDDTIRNQLIVHALDADTDNVAARIAYCHNAYRTPDSLDEARAYAGALTDIAARTGPLHITIKGDEVAAGDADAGWQALQLRVLYNLSVAWFNYYLLCRGADDQEVRRRRSPAWHKAKNAMTVAEQRARAKSADRDEIKELVAELAVAAAITLSTLGVEWERDFRNAPPGPVSGYDLPEAATRPLTAASTYDRACYRVAQQQADLALEDLALATNLADFRTWARKDPSMSWLRSGADAKTRRAYRRIVGEPAPDDFLKLPPWTDYTAKLTEHGLLTAEDLASVPASWIAGRVGVSTVLVDRWRDMATVARTAAAGGPLPISTVFLLFKAGVDTPAKLAAKLAQAADLAALLDKVASDYDVDVPTTADIGAWQPVAG